MGGSGGSSAKDDGDNETKEEGSQASLPFSGGDGDDTKKNGIAAGGAFIVGLLIGVAAVKTGSSASGNKDKAEGEGEDGDKKEDSSSNPSSSSPGNDKKSLEEEDDDEFDAPTPVVHHEAMKSMMAMSCSDTLNMSSRAPVLTSSSREMVMVI